MRTITLLACIPAFCLTISGLVLISQATQAQVTPPTINSVSPLSGSGGILVTISGTGFSSAPASNIVRFGGGGAAVLQSSDTALIVNAPPGATYGPTTVMTGGLTAAPDQRFVLTFGGGGIGSASYFDPQVIGRVSAQTAYLADIDGDGKLDLVGLGGRGNYVSVLRNTSTDSAVSFADSVDFSTGWYGTLRSCNRRSGW